jgi:hypothetical protein
MDSVLIVLTCASVAAAAVFGFSAWRSRTEEARRSAARVAALSAAIDGVDPPSPEPASAATWMPSVAGMNTPVAMTSMFSTASGASVQGRPLMRLAVFGGLATAFLVLATLASRDSAAPSRPSGSADATLELVSMQHTREGRALTVTGLVRNPRAGVPRSNVSATVLAFDRAGGVVASGRAALDFTTLAPGDESPFVVKIPAAPGVARYRVSFRTDEGIVRHVDRRSTVSGGLRASVK